MSENHSRARRRTARTASKDQRGGRITYAESDSNSCSSSESEKEPLSPVIKKNSREKKRKRASSSEKPRHRIKRLLSSDDSESTENETPEKKIDSTDSDVVENVKKHKSKRAKRRKSNKKRNTGRRDIKKILDDKDLEKLTREAAKEERERLQRLKERKKDHIEVDNIEDSPVKKSLGPSVILQKSPYVEVSPYIARNLRPHQVEGVRFIWNNLIESTERAKDGSGGGCILAHCMGLGKTLQTIASIHTFLKSKHLTFKRALVVAPMNTVRNWIAEFVQWCEDGDELNLFNFAEPRSNKARISLLRKWKENGGVLIIGYDMYRIITTKIRYKMWRKTVYETLVDPGPDIVVCDEGHMLKNASTHTSRQINEIKTKRRLVLTGTPLQNNLVEYHCMVNFVKPDLLGSLKEFRNRFVNPILNGQHIDSTEFDVKIMKKRSHVLHQMLEGFVQRKDYSVLKPYLSSKFEYVLKVRLTPLQIKLYQHYLDTKTNRGSNNAVVNSYGKGASLFSDYQNLMRVWTHPKSLLLHSVKREKLQARQADYDLLEEEIEEASMSESDEWRASSGEEDSEDENKNDNAENGVGVSNKKKRGKKQNDNVIEFDSTDSDEITMTKKLKSNERKRKPMIKMSSGDDDKSESYSDGDEDESSASGDVDSDDEDAEKLPHRRMRSKVGKKGKRYRLRCAETSSENDDEELINIDNPSESKEPEWYTEILPEDKKMLENYQNSSKIVILFEILKLAEERKEKVLVFSQSLISLDLIEELLESAPAPCHNVTISDNDDVIPEQPNSQPRRRWFKNIDYFRMDGATQGHHRQRWINAFNDEDDTRSRLFLISTRAGSLGVNLVGANRVVIFDASWNPSHDTQSMFRVYRFGQTKKCYIYRLIAEGTMEEKIYQRQVNKQSLAFRVIDEQQINRHFTASSLAEMYTFNPTTPDAMKDEPTPIVPKDEALAEILFDPRTRLMIACYHEHDSLLDHQVDEELTEEERKAAWEEYEMIKTRGHLPTPGVSDIRRQQQQFANSKNTFTFPATSTQINPTLDETTAILPRLSKMVSNAFYQYQICDVKSVETIMKHLKETPLYINSTDDTLKAIAVEVHYRLELQRTEKFNTFQNLQRQFRAFQTEYFKHVGSTTDQKTFQDSKLSTPSIPSKAALLQQLASTSSGFPRTATVVNGKDSPPPQASITTVAEIIELSDEEKGGTSDTADK